MPGKKQTSAVEEEERKKIDLTIEVEDFGPISGGEITLKPLTVFIGPNNSGKSYAAMLIHSMFRSYIPIASPVDTSTFRRTDISPEEISELKKQFDALEEGEGLDISRQYTELVAKRVLEEVYQKKLNDEIVYSFACLPDELIRIGENLFTLRISHGPCGIHLTCEEGKLKIKKYLQLDQLDIQLDTETRVKATGEPGYAVRYTIGKARREEGPLIEIGELWEKESDSDLALLSLLLPLVNAISNMCASKVLGSVAMQCYYLPAARSGILQGHKALVASIVRKIPYIGVEPVGIPKLSGVVSDFISSIIDLPEEKGPFYELARGFEEEMIRGEIVVSTPSEYLYPEVRYSFQDTEIPLHRSSSTVSELAPLFLYLKYNVKPKNILVIEEPEAHLHPGNQRILARLLVRLVREGVNIIITTHSEYLLEQLRNFILLSKVEPGKRVKKYEYTEEDYLKSDEFAAYVFHYDKEIAGYRIDELEITEDGEISQDEFVKVIDALYEETIKLRIDLSDEA